MKKYIGVKQIEAEPMNLGDYNISRGWTIPENEDPKKDGYRIVYPDEYVSWSPKEIFEEAYKQTTGLTFGLAIEALKLGKLITRSGWNGKGMFIVKQIPSVIGIEIIPKMQSLPQSVKDVLIEREQPICYESQMLIINSLGRADSWVPSSSDCFAEDWQIIE